MEIYNRLQSSIDFIEQNLQEEITINDIAFTSCYSVYHFQRLFSQYVRMPVMEYLRRRRLSGAAYELCKTDKRVFDVALDYQFNYEQSFIRSFKQEFRVTPGAFKKYKTNIPICKKISLVNMSPGIQEPCYILQHSVKIVGSKFKFNYEENLAESTCSKICHRFIEDHLDHFCFNQTMPNIPFYALAQPVPNDPDNAGLIVGFPLFYVKGTPPGMDIFSVPLHINACLIKHNLNFVITKEIDVPYVSEKYSVIHKHLETQPAYRYDPKYYSNYSIFNIFFSGKNKEQFIINVPVMETGPESR